MTKGLYTLLASIDKDRGKPSSRADLEGLTIAFLRGLQLGYNWLILAGLWLFRNFDLLVFILFILMAVM